jgi:hypothetical protein
MHNNQIQNISKTQLNSTNSSTRRNRRIQQACARLVLQTDLHLQPRVKVRTLAKRLVQPIPGAMALNRPGAAELDTRTVFAYAAHEIRYMEAGISVVAAWRHYVGRC